MLQGYLNRVLHPFSNKPIAGLSPRPVLKKPAAMDGSQPRRLPPSGYRHVHFEEESPSLFSPWKEKEDPKRQKHGQGHKPTKINRVMRCKNCGELYSDDWKCKCEGDRRARNLEASAERAKERAQKAADEVKAHEREKRRARDQEEEKHAGQEEAHHRSRIREGRERRRAERHREDENTERKRWNGSAKDYERNQRPQEHEQPRTKRPASSGSGPPPKDQGPPDLYAILGISPSATQEEVQKAAKKNRIENHPDRFSGQNLSPQEVDKIIERSKLIGQSADVLCDPIARLNYDDELKSWRAKHRMADERERRPRGGSHYQREKGSPPKTRAYHATEKRRRSGYYEWSWTYDWATGQDEDPEDWLSDFEVWLNGRGPHKDNIYTPRPRNGPRPGANDKTSGPTASEPRTWTPQSSTRTNDGHGAPRNFQQAPKQDDRAKPRHSDFRDYSTDDDSDTLASFYTVHGFPAFGGPVPFKTSRGGYEFHAFEQSYPSTGRPQGYR